MALYPFTVNGVTYNEVDFLGMAYTTGVPNSMADILKQALLLYAASSTSSVTVGTGTKNLTIDAGRAYRANDYVCIVFAGTPITVRMYGRVISYDFNSGALSVNVTSFIGSGTGANWRICPGAIDANFGSSDFIATLDNGGTGYGVTSFVQPCGFLGLDSPPIAMAEIFEDFTGTQGQTRTSPTTQIGPTYPWYCTASYDYGTPPSTATNANSAGWFYLKSSSINAARGIYGNAILQYGDHGFFHVGKGACTWESKVYGVGAVTPYIARMGLRANATSFSPDIFQAGCIGFKITDSLNNGRYILMAGADGSIVTFYTNISPSSSGDKLFFSVDHDASSVDFYINSTYAGTITTTLPCNNPNNLLAPAFESQCYLVNGLVVTTGFYIDYMYLRKFLLR